MNLTEFTNEQKLALLDLLVLGMYADRHLALAEDARIARLLESMQLPTELTSESLVDASVTKLRARAGSPDGRAAMLVELGGIFGTPAARRKACDALDDVLSSDDRVTEAERQFLTAVRSTFGC